MSDIVDRLRLPIDADKIYNWVVEKRKETRSDFSRLGFSNSMELLDEERAEAAAEILRLRAELADMTADRDLWKQSEEVASDQFNKARAKAFEEAAKVVDDLSPKLDAGTLEFHPDLSGYQEACNDIAQAIRAMIDKE